ncbi:hypothetical protein BG74_02295 [Sodalis-like endosymbiont of Proechinophthirus fluctus]|nr:hypothetical protein BG74_02295 [Sodalis-like endosymbiont of Proechinophthirus fluctus]
MKVLLENLLCHQDSVIVTEADLREVAGWLKIAHAEGKIAYRPALVLIRILLMCRLRWRPGPGGYV